METLIYAVIKREPDGTSWSMQPLCDEERSYGGLKCEILGKSAQKSKIFVFF